MRTNDKKDKRGVGLVDKGWLEDEEIKQGVVRAQGEELEDRSHLVKCWRVASSAL